MSWSNTTSGFPYYYPKDTKCPEPINVSERGVWGEGGTCNLFPKSGGRDVRDGVEKENYPFALIAGVVQRGG